MATLAQAMYAICHLQSTSFRLCPIQFSLISFFWCHTHEGEGRASCPTIMKKKLSLFSRQHECCYLINNLMP